MLSGRMLQRAHEFLVPDGYLFLALPLPCVENSRYFNHDQLKAVMELALSAVCEPKSCQQFAR